MADVANIIKYLHTDGVETVYAIIRNMDNEFYDVTTSHEFETFVAANWATFKMAMAEVAAAGAGENVPLEGDWPEHLTTVGYYWVDFYIQAGGTAAQTDLLLSSILFFWNGTTLLPAEAMIGTPNGATVAADIAAVKAETVLIVADTGTTLPAAIISAHVDTDADIAAVKAETALIYADTDDLQTSQGDWATAVGFATPTNITEASGVALAADQAVNVTQWGGTATVAGAIPAVAAGDEGGLAVLATVDGKLVAPAQVLVLNANATDGTGAARPTLQLAQLRCLCDAPGEGAMHLDNTSIAGKGQSISGGQMGQYLYGLTGQYISGGLGVSGYGQFIHGYTGQEIIGDISGIPAAVAAVAAGDTAGSIGKAAADAAADAATAKTQTTAANLRATIGMATSDLDTQLAAIPSSDANAQAVLKMSVSDVQDTASLHSLTTLVLGATESSISGDTWTIKKTTGATFTTKTVTSDTDAVPIVGVT